MREFDEKIEALENGSYDVFYRDKRYLMSKETHLEGKLIKFYAKELGGNDFVSLNYYPYVKNGLLKPCEMPVEKVVTFIKEMRLE
jgi:hypothetical protein